MSSVSRFFSEEQRSSIKKAIEDAEVNTSGEIRVHIDERCKEEVLAKAQKVFDHLKMYNTKERNAVLFYLALRDRKFAIVGDKGIHKKVPEGFWDGIRDRMENKFTQKQFTEGLCEGIKEAGLQLKQHFPHRKNDSNELSNEITFNRI